MFTGFEKRIRRAADTGARAESDGKSFCAVTNNTMIKRQARMINIFVSAARFDKSGFLIMTGGVFHSRRSVFRLHVNTCAFENHVGRIHFAYCVFNSLEYIRRTVEIRFYDGKKKEKISIHDAYRVSHEDFLIAFHPSICTYLDFLLFVRTTFKSSTLLHFYGFRYFSSI